MDDPLWWEKENRDTQKLDCEIFYIDNSTTILDMQADFKVVQWENFIQVRLSYLTSPEISCHAECFKSPLE